MTLSPERISLANGLTLLLAPNHAAPVVSMAMWVNVGAADEGEGEEGLAHVHEHMLFKGTARRGVGEIAREVEACGGEINAFTSLDHTVYYVTMASRFMIQGLDVLCDAIRHSAFDPQELEREREVILEEFKRGQDQPWRLRSEQLFGLAFDTHNYQRPVIGTEASIKGLTREDVLRFFNRWYTASNMTLVVAGDIDAAQVREAVEARLGDMPAVEAPTHSRAAEPPQRELRVRMSAGETREVYTGMAFHIPGVDHEDGPTLDVLRLLLCYGDSSRLVSRLERELGWVNDISAGAWMPRDPGLFIVTLDHMPAEDHPGVPSLVEVTLAEIAAMGERPPSAEAVLRARTLLESSQVHQRQTIEGQAMVLGSYEVAAGGLEKEALYYQRLRHVSPESIQAVIKKTFRLENLSIVVHAGQETLDTLDEDQLRLAARRGLGAETALLPGPRATIARDEDRISRIELPNGPTLLIQEDPSVGLVSLRALFAGGQRAERADKAGACQLMSGLWTRGTQARTLTEVAREIETMGGGMDAYAGRNSVGVQMEILATHLTRGLSLLADCLTQPLFDEELIAVEKRLTLEAIEARQENHGAVVGRLARRALFGDHPYAQDLLGTPETLAALTRDDLLATYRRQVQPERMVLSIVGDVVAEEIAEIVAERFADARFLGGPLPDDPGLPEIAPMARLEAPRVVTHTLPKQQAVIILGFQGVDLRDPARPAMDVLSAVLSGQGGRLFMELRDRQSLAYSVYSQLMVGVDPGSFTLNIATSPEKITQAVQGLLHEVRRLREEPITQDELARAQRYLVGHHDIQLQSFSSRAMQMGLDELYNLGYRNHRIFPDEVLNVTVDDIQRTCQRILDPQRAILAAVHPPDTPWPEGLLDLP